MEAREDVKKKRFYTNDNTRTDNKEDVRTDEDVKPGL